MKPGRNPQVLRHVIAGFAIVVAIAAALYAFAPNIQNPNFVEGRPLLTQYTQTFADSQIGLQLNPPERWSMQARSTDAPHNHRPERLVVKFKRLIPGQPVAWLRVAVADAPADQTPAELLRNRKPPEPEWKTTKEVEDNVTFAGKPAARITFGGPFDPDGKGPRDFTCEMIAVRRGPQAIYISGTYGTPDKKAREQIYSAIATAVLN